MLCIMQCTGMQATTDCLAKSNTHRGVACSMCDVHQVLPAHTATALPFRRGPPIGGGAPQGWPVCACVCLSVCNKTYFRFSALTPFRDLRFKTWPRKLCSATLTLSRALEMASRARPQDVSGFRDLGSVSQKSS